jgi:peroxiredoxin
MFIPPGLLLAAALALQPIPSFELQGAGNSIRMIEPESRATVIVFLGVDCPLANLYAPRLKDLAVRYSGEGARFLAVNSNDFDTAPELAAFVWKHGLSFPFVKDADDRAAEALGATRTPEAFVVDRNRRVRYRGRIDDQYAAGGKNHPIPSRHDLEEAIREVLAGQPVSVAVTRSSGCLLSRPRRTVPAPSVVYSRDIAPILEANCAVCHRPGEIGPFSLTTFAEARNHARTIAEVVEEGRMPPWHASARFGRFRNERRLTLDEKKLILDWVRLGCPEGESVRLEPIPDSTGWAIGKPDAIFPIPAPFAVPAEGIIEYQHFLVDPGFVQDTWVAAAEVRPGNRRVVHHCTVFLQPPNVSDPKALFDSGALGSNNLVAFTPGSGPLVLPEGMAKRVPAGWRLYFVVHYTPIGSPVEDRTELGLRLLDPAAVRKEAATKLLYDANLAIPPNAAAHAIEMTWTADRDYLLLSMFPHMHLRGKSFRYTAEYANGLSEVLLDVPNYDFNWQHRYELTEPKRLPAGTVLRCRAIYDNSAGNPANPDPTATVRAGVQSWDEMFNGYFDVVLANQDMPLERDAANRKRTWFALVLAITGLIAAAWATRLRRQTGQRGV